MYKAITNSDVSAVFRLYKQAYPKGFSAQEFRDNLRSREDEGYEVYFVTYQDKIIGTAGIQLAKNPIGHNYMNVDMVVVDTQGNLRRVANVLAGFLISHARAMSLTAIEVDGTKYGKQCEQFLKSIGFKPSQGKYCLTLNR